MRTNIKSNEVPFGKLKIGDTFFDKDFGTEEIFMVVEPSVYVLIEPDKECVPDDIEFFGYGVSLTTGSVFGYPESEMVIPVRTEVMGYM